MSADRNNIWHHSIVDLFNIFIITFINFLTCVCFDGVATEISMHRKLSYRETLLQYKANFGHFILDILFKNNNNMAKDLGRKGPWSILVWSRETGWNLSQYSLHHESNPGSSDHNANTLPTALLRAKRILTSEEYCNKKAI